MQKRSHGRWNQFSLKTSEWTNLFAHTHFQLVFAQLTPLFDSSTSNDQKILLNNITPES